MGHKNIRFPSDGKSLNKSEAKQFIDSLSNTSIIKGFSGSWVVAFQRDLLGEDEGQVLLLPKIDSLLTAESLKTIYDFVSVFNANISFDSSVAFGYGTITIVGKSDLANGFDSNLEQEIREFCKVERLSCTTSHELIQILRARIDDDVPFGQ